MKLRKAVIICGVISAMIISYISLAAIKEDRCWYSTLHHYKSVVSTYARQVLS